MCNHLKREMSNANLLSRYRYPSFPDKIVCQEPAKRAVMFVRDEMLVMNFVTIVGGVTSCDFWCRDNPCTQKLILSLLKSVHVTAVILTSDASYLLARLLNFNFQYSVPALHVCIFCVE